MKKLAKKLKERIETNSAQTFKYKLQFKHKFGDLIPVEVYTVPLINNGKINEILIVAHEIKERIRRENELIAAKEKAEESDRLKSAFLANMSHEIRTPINGILGFINLLQTSDISEEQHQLYHYYIKASSERLVNTINDIIEISKIESGQMLLNFSEMDVHELMMLLHATFQTEVQKKGLSFVLANEGAGPLMINTDKNKLESILSNLIKNAIKFTTEGYIKTGYELSGKTLTFWVKDTGRGIARERFNAIFERFVQADLVISRPYEGSGLGLSIAKAYANMLNGKLWVDSEINKGSTFYFSMPYNPVSLPEKN